MFYGDTCVAAATPVTWKSASRPPTLAFYQSQARQLRFAADGRSFTVAENMAAREFSAHFTIAGEFSAHFTIANGLLNARSSTYVGEAMERMLWITQAKVLALAPEGSSKLLLYRLGVGLKSTNRGYMTDCINTA